MRKWFVWLVVLGAIAAAVFCSTNDEPREDSHRAESARAHEPQLPGMSRPIATAGQREPGEASVAEPGPPRALRGRVVDEQGAPLEGWGVVLYHAGVGLARTQTSADGRFEFSASLRAGTEVKPEPPHDWSVEPSELELDSLPEEELLFVARLDPSSAVKGAIRGTVVDETDGRPLPFLKGYVSRGPGNGESIETDGEGRFETIGSYSKGKLSFAFAPESEPFDLGGFDPLDPAPLSVPARVGPALYVEITGAADELVVKWSEETLPHSARVLGLDSMEKCSLRLEPPALVMSAWQCTGNRSRSRGLRAQLRGSTPRRHGDGDGRSLGGSVRWRSVCRSGTAATKGA